MEYIFISHSQYDKQLRDFFAHTIRRIRGLDCVFMEFENLHYQNAGKIITDIISQSCIGLVVLLGKKILFPPGYTPQFKDNWVGFEVGVAACAKKPIMIFEDYEDPIEFPILYLDHFVRYRQDEEHSWYIVKMLRDNMPVQKDLASDKIRCPYTDCNAEYSYWSIREKMYCPVCRGNFIPGQDVILRKGERSNFMPCNVV
jgi:hypothetical protein